MENRTKIGIVTEITNASKVSFVEGEDFPVAIIETSSGIDAHNIEGKNDIIVGTRVKITPETRQVGPSTITQSKLEVIW